MSTVTRVVITSHGRDFTLPGLVNEDEFRNSYGSSIDGLSGMAASVEDGPDGRTLTFSPRTGNKG